jgi:hypothetical protein
MRFHLELPLLQHDAGGDTVEGDLVRDIDVKGGEIEPDDLVQPAGTEHLERLLPVLKGEALDEAQQPQEVVAVEVRNEDALGV